MKLELIKAVSKLVEGKDEEDKGEMPEIIRQVGILGNKLKFELREVRIK